MTEMQELLAERAGLSFDRIKEIETEQECPEIFQDYFVKAAKFVSLMREQWDFVSSGAIMTASLEELQKRNHAVYEEVLPENYETSYVNPEYTQKVFGVNWGKILSVLMAELRGMIGSVYEQELEGVVIRLELLLQCYSEICSEKVPDAEAVRKILYWYVSDYSETRMERRVGVQVDPAFDFAANIVMESDLDDPRFLYRYGEFVGEEQLRTLAFLQRQTPERLRLMADTFTEGYRIGFVTTNRDISIKKSVNIRFALGFEPMIRIAVENFKKMGLSTTMYRAGANLFEGYSMDKNGFFGKNPNKQFDFDHMEDLALLLDGMLVTRKLECLKAAYEVYRKQAKVFGGPAVLEIFGERDFEPITKEAAPAYSEEQQKLCVEYAGKAGQITNTYIPGEERSYTIIAFPVPDIGEQFEAIFDETIRINTLDYKKYQKIQQIIINALDQGTEVAVKGAEENKTDLRIMLHTLSDPVHQTNFENCVADVNIPVGEVFTSPVLKGTEGILHVTKVFLNGLEYKDLYIELKDGMISDYGCANFTKRAASGINAEQDAPGVDEGQTAADIDVGKDVLSADEGQAAAGIDAGKDAPGVEKGQTEADIDAGKDAPSANAGQGRAAHGGGAVVKRTADSRATLQIDKEAGRKLMNDHILFHHETLPIGEFAIGTNTLAFVMARKYGIERKMPILIAEKTGPHFAFGDTCYSHCEDVPMIGPDGKEMIAKDNECSILRNEDPQKAYFNCHTDITIPYNELGELSVIRENGDKIPIILKGRFVLKGTEALNEAFEE